MPASTPISVVIPCFNQGRFLAEAIDSVLAQDHDPVEIVAVDDGSTDETLSVLERYPRARVVRREHGGVAAARNAGLAVSRGAFVVFLDADDRLVSGALATNLRVLRADPACAWVAGHHRQIDERGRPLRGPRPPTSEPNVYEQLLRGNFVHTAAVMYRREPLLAVGGFDPRLQVCEDWDLYLRLARAQPAAVHDRIVSEYRRYGTQTTARMPELLLYTGLALLRAQQASLVGQRERAALRAGCRSWRDHYVEELLLALRADLRQRRLLRVASRAAVLARHAPTTVRRVARALVNRVGRWRRGAEP